MPVRKFTIQVTAYYTGDEKAAKQHIADILKDTSCSSAGKEDYHIEVRNAKVIQ